VSRRRVVENDDGYNSKHEDEVRHCDVDQHQIGSGAYAPVRKKREQEQCIGDDSAQTQRAEEDGEYNRWLSVSPQLNIRL